MIALLAKQILRERDGEGNRIIDFRTDGSNYNDYIYDNRNRLTMTTDPLTTQSVAYTYDPNNTRIEEADFTSGTTHYTEFGYDGSGNLLMELTGSASSATVTDRYMADPLGGSAPLDHEDTSGNVVWYITNQNGSVQSVINNSGGFVDSALFDGFGHKIVTDSNATAESVFGF